MVEFYAWFNHDSEEQNVWKRVFLFWRGANVGIKISLLLDGSELEVEEHRIPLKVNLSC